MVRAPDKLWRHTLGVNPTGSKAKQCRGYFITVMMHGYAAEINDYRSCKTVTESGLRSAYIFLKLLKHGELSSAHYVIASPLWVKKALRNDPAFAKATTDRQCRFVQSLLQLAIYFFKIIKTRRTYVD